MVAATNSREYSCWLLKAEPESRLEKGHDVKFSVDDFEKVKVTAWEGVRNHQAKNFLKEKMKMGDRALFYASSCKVPGVTALAKVVREGYPDHNAWDPQHPYYDPKSNSENPTWFMVDLEFVSRLPNKVSLSFLQQLAGMSEAPEPLKYLTKAHLDAIKSMTLLNRGRLSVQPVEDLAFDAIKLLGYEGGFEELQATKKSNIKSLKIFEEPIEGEQKTAIADEGQQKVKISKAKRSLDGTKAHQNARLKSTTRSKAKAKIKSSPDNQLRRKRRKA